VPNAASARVSRRGLLTLAAAAALPAACSRRAPSETAAAPTTQPATGSTSIAPAATASRPKPAPTPAAKVKTAKVVPPGGGPVPYHRGKVLLGSYLSLQGRSLAQSLALRRQQLGRDQRIVHVYYDWADALPRSRGAIGSGSTLMVSWHGTHYADITGGGSDKRIAAAARNLAAIKKPTLLRWGWEMNGNWFDWDGTHNGKNPAGYIKAWRRIHKIFRNEGAGNVAFVWSPNWNSGPDVSWNAYERYYPGDAYVDWVGVSAYPFSGQTPRTLFHRICEVYGDRKPIMATETASIDHGGSTKADWIKAFSAYVAATPAIGGVVWFDTDTQGGTDVNFRPDTTKASLAAYRAMARSPHFAG
jgi:glycosyl hydrolase family 26